MMDALSIYAIFLTFAALFALGAFRLAGAADDASDQIANGDVPHLPPGLNLHSHSTPNSREAQADHGAL